MTAKEVSLVKRRFCQDRRIKDEKSVLLTHLHRNLSTGEHTFLVEREGHDNAYYTHKKVDLGPLSTLRTLDIPKEYRNDFDAQHNKAFIAEWIRRKTGHDVIDTDISTLLSGKGTLDIIISPDSMRFKNSFQLIRL